MKRFKKLLPVIGITCIMISISLILYNYIVKQEQERCWQILEENAHAICHIIKTKVEDENIKLQLFAELMILEDVRSMGEEERLHVDLLCDSTFFSRVEIIYPDGNIVSSDGTHMTLPDDVTFSEVVSYQGYLSSRKIDSRANTECIYYTYPVDNGEDILAVLVGVIILDDMYPYFYTDIYGERANICLIDRRDGCFLLDNWHDTLGNIYEMEVRQKLPTYEDTDIQEMIRNGETGVSAFYSQTTGKPLYMYITPIGVFDWHLLLFIQEDVLFENLISVRKMLYLEEVVEIVLLLIYFFWNFSTVCQLEKRNAEIQQQREQLRKISYHDQLTGIYNRNRYEELLRNTTEQEIQNAGIVYIDLNGLKEINDTQSHAAGDRYICGAADAISEVFCDAGYRIGGDEFVVVVQDIKHEIFSQKTDALHEEMERHKVLVSIGTAWQETCHGYDTLIKKAEQEMYAEKKAYYSKHERRRSDDR